MFKQLPKIFRKFAKDLMTSAIMSGCGSFGFALSDKKTVIFNAYKLDKEDGDDNWLSITDIESGVTLKLTDNEFITLCNVMGDFSDFLDSYQNKEIQKENLNER